VREDSWYALDISPPSCRELFEQTGFSTPSQLTERAGCRYDETNVPNATRMYCPNEGVYLFLYPDEQSCEAGLETIQRNMDAWQGTAPNSPPDHPR
jgi:hypothetical protein